MSAYFREPTLVELLSDPMTRAVMRADAVNPRELEEMLRRIARGRAESSAGGGWRSCCQMSGGP